MKTATLEEITNLCIRRGFFFPSGKIYGGLSGFYDYGPLGVELRNEILNSWWNFFVRNREDIVGIHGSILTHPKTWEASGHTESFIDIIVKCTRCSSEFRADHLLEDKGIKITELTIENLRNLIKKHNIKCPICKGELSDPEPFNLMFQTYVGPKKTKANIAYLRPETAQLIFTNFKVVSETQRAKLPFGIAQWRSHRARARSASGTAVPLCGSTLHCPSRGRSHDSGIPLPSRTPLDPRKLDPCDRS